MKNFSKYLRLIPIVVLLFSMFVAPAQAQKLPEQATAGRDPREFSAAEVANLYLPSQAAQEAYERTAADPKASEAARNWLEVTHTKNFEAQQAALAKEQGAQPKSEAPAITLTPAAPISDAAIPGGVPIDGGPKTLNKPAVFQGGARTINVKILHYVTVITGVAQFPAIVNSHKLALEQGSKFQGSGAQALSYNVISTSTINGAAPAIVSGTLSGTLDIAAIYNTYGFCSQMNSGSLDQVWIWSDGFSTTAGYEFVVNGHAWSVYTSLSNIPKCGRAGAVFSFVYANNLSYPNPATWFPAIDWQAPHSYAHFVEQAHVSSLQWDYSVCDFVDGAGRSPSAANGNVTYAGSYCPGRPLSGVYGFTAHPDGTNGNIGVCGDVHFPVNSPTTGSSYIYTTTTTVQSICNTWKWGLANPATAIGCNTWSASCGNANTAQYDYLKWWMQRFPSVTTNATGRTGAARPNHWNKVPALIPTTDPVIRNNFDADLDTDFVLYRPSTGKFWILTTPGGVASQNSTACSYASNNPITGKDTSGIYFVQDLGTGNLYRASFGFCLLWGAWGAGSNVSFAYMDAHPYSDYASYTQSTGNWLITSSSGATTTFTLGGAGFVTAIADYDGDGYQDAAVYNKTTGEWRIRPSSTGVVYTTTWGAGSIYYVPAPLDLDGDNRADITVFNTNDGYWHTQAKTVLGNSVSQQYGAAGDIPVAADYNGDGYDDYAVFRQSTGQWFLRDRFNATTTVSFGTVGDIPVSQKPW